MGLLNLPTELLHGIVDWLHLDSDINSLCQTSRQLHMLLDNRLYQNNVTRYDSCGIDWAVRKGRASAVDQFLRAGAPLAHPIYRYSPICIATEERHDDVVMVFLDRGVRPYGRYGWWLKQSEPEPETATNCELIWDHHEVMLADEDPMATAIVLGHISLVELFWEYGGMWHWNANKVIAAICVAIATNRCEIVKFMLQKYPDTTAYVLQYGNSARLLRQTSHTDMARFLIGLGISPNIVINDEPTALCHAAMQGNLELVRLLVDQGACPDPPAPNGITLYPLVLAAQEGHFEVVQYLMTCINVKIKMSARGEDLLALLLVAAIFGFEDIVMIILGIGIHADSTCPSCGQWLRFKAPTPLAAATRNGNVNIATLLLESGADPDELSQATFHPLAIACRFNHPDLVKLLVQYGANVNCTYDDFPALYFVMHSLPLLDFLVADGADCGAEYDFGHANIITEAIQSGNVALVQRLLDHGTALIPPSLSPRDRRLINSAIRGGVDLLESLCSYGIIPCPGDEEAQTGLKWAIRHGDSRTTEYLLKPGFSPEPIGQNSASSANDYHDSYLLEAAVAEDSTAAAATLDILLRYGADINKVKRLPDLRDWGYSKTAKEVTLRALRLLFDREVSPLPEDEFGSAVLSGRESVLARGTREHENAVQLSISFVEKRGLSLDDIHRNLMLVEELSETRTEDQRCYRPTWYMVRLWRQLYWRKRHPVPN